jgi:UDP-3-O-[3-hydroxymyristoyl] N-acetylglucosamine deacetylase
MDGLPLMFPQTTTQMQRTLKAPISCVGVGLHSGRKLRLVLRPAPTDSGIVFRRSDLGINIPARYDHVIDTRLCTVLALPGEPSARIGTVEHILAALAGSGVTNAIVEIDGPEIPILDGSAASFLFLIDCAGLATQSVSAPVIEITRKVRVEKGEAFAELHPAAFGMGIDMSIAFDAPAIGSQSLGMQLTPESFRRELARARTFTQAREIAALRAAGLALGGSLDNAVVVDEAQVLNPCGLRMPDEFVRHKMLDAVGDLSLAGATLRARLVARRSGHALNNQLLRAVFADDANWRLLPAMTVRMDSNFMSRPGSADATGNGSASLPSLGSWQERKLPVAAAPF